MKITAIKFYNGAKEKISRLGMAALFLELLEILLETRVLLLEERDANGAAEVRRRLDASFEKAGGWQKTSSGGIDWRKRQKYNNQVAVCLGVEIQVSARSDLLIRDIVHLRNSLQRGEIDVGTIVVPSDLMQTYLPDRTPSLNDALRYIEQEFTEAQTYPIVVIAIEHDGPSDVPLPKQPRKS